MLLLSRCTYSSCPFAIQISHITCQKGGDEFVPLALFFWVGVCLQQNVPQTAFVVPELFFHPLCVCVRVFPPFIFSLPPSLSLSVPRSRKINRPCCLVPFFTQTFIVYVFVCSRSLAVGTTQPVFVVCDECLRETDAVDKRTNKAACGERDERERERERQGFRKIQSNVRASRRKECMRQENQFLKKQI